MTLDQARGFLDMTPKHKTKIKKSKLELVKIAKESNTTYQLNNNKHKKQVTKGRNPTPTDKQKLKFLIHRSK